MAPVMRSLVTCISICSLLASATPIWKRYDIFHARRAVALASYKSCEKHADQKKCQPVSIDYNFQVTVPVLTQSFSAQAPSVDFGGLHIRLPKEALSGELVSFFGNFENNQTTSSQTQITTQSDSTSVADGTSTSNATATANSTTIVAVTFSSGNASSAAGSAQQDSTVTSTSSSGSADSQASAVADANGIVTITTSATDTSVANMQSLRNEQEAAAATSCVAQNDGASAEAEAITIVQFTTANGTLVTSTAYAACCAGLVAPSEVNATSSSGSIASVGGVSANVFCNGVESTSQTQSTTFRLRVLGTWGPLTGFQGAITGRRVAEVEESC